MEEARGGQGFSGRVEGPSFDGSEHRGRGGHLRLPPSHATAATIHIVLTDNQFSQPILRDINANMRRLSHSLSHHLPLQIRARHAAHATVRAHQGTEGRAPRLRRRLNHPRLSRGPALQKPQHQQASRQKSGTRPLSSFLPNEKGRHSSQRRPSCIAAIAPYSLPVSSGTSVNRSPTRPTSATWKIGASSSLLMATMILESFMPARCWIAPEMPTAT